IKMLREAERAMREAPCASYPAGRTRPAVGLDAAIEGTRKGEDWNLTLLVRRNRRTGARRVVGAFKPEDAPKMSARAASVLAAQDKADGWLTQATVIVPCRGVVGPLLTD